MDQKTHVYIVGAGISGLIAALELEQAGFYPVVIEQSGEVGGRVKTMHEHGVALDLGFQVLLSAYPAAQRYLDMDALQLRKLAPGALIYVGDKAYRIGDPLRDWSTLLPTLLADVGSIGDKFKILKLNRYLKQKSIASIFATPERTTLDYLQAFGFSPKIIERFFRPFFAGIFLEPDLHTSSRMFEFVYKMFGEGYATIPKDGIGAISEQLRARLTQTAFRFNCAVKRVTNNTIELESGEVLPHEGVIVATNQAALIDELNPPKVAWKSCVCLYFEVDHTNIPEDTIALIADRSKRSNNLYGFTDPSTGKRLLSVTSVQHQGCSDSDLIEAVTDEVKAFTGATRVRHIRSYQIDQALPDMNDLHSFVADGQNRVHERVFLAGDSLLNGSLNAAMESGRSAARGWVEYKKTMNPE